MWSSRRWVRDRWAETEQHAASLASSGTREEFARKVRQMGRGVRAKYGRRPGIVESVFGDIRSTQSAAASRGHPQRWDG